MGDGDARLRSPMDRWRERHAPRLVRPVRLMCEVHVDLPVWVLLAPGEDDLYDDEDPPWSDGLTAELREWQDRWSRHIHLEAPVDDDVAEVDLRYFRGEHVNRGHALRRWAETELGLEVELVL